MTALPFLTAWDPTDLPGMSVDPLGFDRAYGWLSDQLLPNLTNVARHPRYFSILLAGACLGPTSEPARQTRKELLARQDLVLRLERLWALGHVALENELPGASSGIRGITYANGHFQELERKHRGSTTTKFKLLLSQVRYGALGIYGNVASGLRLTEGPLLPTPDFGERLGQAFLENTKTPPSVRRAVLDDQEKTEVGLKELADWVRRAGVNAPMSADELEILASAMNENERRRRLGHYLQENRWDPGQESELTYLKRLEECFTQDDADLRDVARAIGLFELCFRTLTLVLERLLWRCGREHALALKSLGGDDVVKGAATSLPRAIQAFFDHADGCDSGAIQPGAERMTDLRRFLSDAACAGNDVEKLVEVTVKRHAEVQSGKLLRGRAKLPWLEIVDGQLRLTLARANRVEGEPSAAEDIPPHAYRLHAARAFLLGNGAAL